MNLSPFPLINAVLLGSQTGEVFYLSDNKFVIHKSGFSYIFENDKFPIDDFIDLILNKDSIPQYFHIYNPPKQLVSRIQQDER
ncbi:MAG: hypothetical protein MI922_28200, partial [Bacteroidales bacterium]|nr:hypothetical protein [Bacteroidales bacterium]